MIPWGRISRFPNVTITGDEDTHTRSVLTVIGGEELKAASILSKLADVSLRSTNSDVLTDLIDTEQTNLSVIAERNIAALHGNHSPTIAFTDKRVYDGDNAPVDTPKDASVTLSAGGDIGERGNYLLVDIPEELTLVIDQATNLFVRGVRTDENREPARDTRDYQITEGYSEALAKQVTGDYEHYDREEDGWMASPIQWM